MPTAVTRIPASRSLTASQYVLQSSFTHMSEELALSTTATAPATAEETVAKFLDRPHRMLIGQDWVDAQDGATLAVENPASGTEIAQVPAAKAADVDRAVGAARASYEAGAWRGLPGVKRAEILWHFAELIGQNAAELAHLEVLDNGMPYMFARYTVDGAMEVLRYFASRCTDLGGKSANADVASEMHAYTQRVPVGVAGLIIPWNGPLGMAAAKLAPSLAAGCSVILKPAEQTPLSALRLGQLALEAGIPPGVLNIVVGTGTDAGAVLAQHPDVDKISFTGSTSAGKSLVRAAAGNLKRLSLELGGKSPVFVFDDADLATTIPSVAMGIFANSGQVCFAGSRVYAQPGIHDALVDGLRSFAEQLPVGSGLDAATMLGPLISSVQRDRVLAHIESGRNEGAEVVTGGCSHGDRGYFVQPTIFAKVEQQMAIAREEIFGPVLAVSTFDDLSDVARLGNDSVYGLGAAIYTTNVSTAHKATAALNAGNIWVNCQGILDRNLPFGGFKQSGWGRENGSEGIAAFLEDKTIYVKL